MDMEFLLVILSNIISIIVAAAIEIEEEVVRACEAFSFDEE